MQPWASKFDDSWHSEFLLNLAQDREWLCTKLRRPGETCLRVATANVTAWRSGLACFKEGAMSGFDVIGLQEHRLNGAESILQARHSLEKLGWRSLFKWERNGEAFFTSSKPCFESKKKQAARARQARCPTDLRRFPVLRNNYNFFTSY